MSRMYFIPGANMLVVTADLIKSFPTLKADLMKLDKSGVSARSKFILINAEPDSCFDSSRTSAEFEKVFQLAAQLYLLHVDLGQLMDKIGADLTEAQRAAVEGAVKQTNTLIRNRDLT